jgi:choice-of-anchor C domain-containing protein
MHTSRRHEPRRHIHGGPDEPHDNPDARCHDTVRVDPLAKEVAMINSSIRRWLLVAVILLVAACVGSLVASPDASAARRPPRLVQDGDFEYPVVPTDTFKTLVAGAQFHGWHVIGSVDITNTDYWQAGHGAQSVDLNGFSTGGLWRDITTTPGTDYVLRFRFAGNPDTVCGRQGIKRMTLTAGTSEKVLAFNTVGHTKQSLGWRGARISFKAQARSTRVTFRSLSGSCAGPTIDFVHLATPVRCRIGGTAGPDLLVGTSPGNVICGGRGNDVMDGRGGNDFLRGGQGADVVVGGRGADTLLGGPGPDVLFAKDGVSGNDTVRGGRGVDVCVIDKGDTATGCEVVANRMTPAVRRAVRELAERL